MGFGILRNRFSVYMLAWVPSFLICLLISFVLMTLLNYSFHVENKAWSPSIYRALLNSSSVFHTILTTLLLAAIVTIFCNMLGFPVVRLISRTPNAQLRRFVLLGLFAVLMSGAVTRGYAWMLILGKHGIVNQTLAFFSLPSVRLMNNLWGVIITMTSVTLPFYILTLFGAMKGLTPDLERAASNLGASSWQSLRYVVIPLALPGLVAASSVCFSLSLGAFLYPELLGGGRVRVLATAIYDDVQTAYNVPRAAALSVIFLVVALLIKFLPFCFLHLLRGVRKV
ncbi:MAG: ABC transporter permease [Acetobacter sp.]